ncbi:hypothetical protein HBA54_04935 [Pelagibius litoralis]|uniref:Uncharacterized protein n=1 Tax=Pelagibius litoralis TaxID=374515 RepID=A0A967C3L5_9PROT|nr:hypothetical protein [Pelagibius litoralis]NIA67930.1 hypothetical protein [Pelagibius litoralis]
MGKIITTAGSGLRMAACIAVAGFVLATSASPAAAARNEARWYQQNYCLVKAYEALGNKNAATHNKHARQSRAKLIRLGVPEHHLRELEGFIDKTIRKTSAGNKAHQGPRICMQWYST